MADTAASVLPHSQVKTSLTDYFYEAVTSAAGMVSTTPGVGSAYLGAYKDKNGHWFDERTYALPDFEEVAK